MVVLDETLFIITQYGYITKWCFFCCPSVLFRLGSKRTSSGQIGRLGETIPDERTSKSGGYIPGKGLQLSRKALRLEVRPLPHSRVSWYFFTFRLFPGSTDFYWNILKTFYTCKCFVIRFGYFASSGFSCRYILNLNCSCSFSLLTSGSDGSLGM